MPHHKGTKIHEDAQNSSVLLCGFVSLWLVVTKHKRRTIMCALHIWQIICHLDCRSQRSTAQQRPYINACQAKRLTMPTAMTISTIAAMIMLLM